MRGIPGAPQNVTESPLLDKNARISDNHNTESDYEDDIDGVPCTYFT